jgi:GTP-binding protein HflX
VDTVGLVRRLPHHLVQAFRSTLEEAVAADVILHVCDAASPEVADHIGVATALLEELGVGDTPVLTVFNKTDIAPVPDGYVHVYPVSGATGAGLPALLEAVAAALPPDRRRVTLLIPFSRGDLAHRCRTEGALEAEEYTPEGVRLTATLGMPLLAEVGDYEVS